MSKEGRLSPGDPSSYARPDIAKVTFTDLSLEVDFTQKILSGHVIHTVEKVDPSATHVILDSRFLEIEAVTNNQNGEQLKCSLGPDGFVGSKLEVELPNTPSKEVQIKLVYRTTSKCSALQWLDPAQTASKTDPYMFSQCQTVHCRSMIPCQDTPLVKAPYSAKIVAPANLTVLMSAIRLEGSNGDDPNVHSFVQKVPIQSYLIAIAVGKLESRKIGPRSHVWSEKDQVDEAAFDFSETDTMLKIAEEICGPYVWGIYDILVLPPSFPYGGMENPCLTFTTPTLLTGNRSLSGVIAHEIAHSWTGNLVTNKNFEHFWLNEGFTVFTERKILGRMFGEATRHFEAFAGWKMLKDAINVFGETSPLTSLVVDLTDTDPDDAFSDVPYEKGSAFLWHLEELVGGPDKFEPFLRAYYDHFKYQSIDSYQFKEFFEQHFEDVAKAVDWEDWFKSPGMPKHKPNYDDSLSKVCANLSSRWFSYDVRTMSNFSPRDLDSFSPAQKLEFLAELLERDPLSNSKISEMSQLYGFGNSPNCEIRSSWIRLGLKAEWEPIIPLAVQMVTEQGRMKFLRPIYRAMYAWEHTRQLAIDTFKKNIPNMMHVAIQGIETDLKLR